jgi:hypothetical protein
LLPERYRQLLTASVDGELTPRQRRRVERLLARYPEGRQMLEKLQQDALALRHLPARQPPADFSAGVLEEIHRARLRPSRYARLSGPAILPAWTGVAVAAVVLLVVGLASYFYFALSLPPRPSVAGVNTAAAESAPKPSPSTNTDSPTPAPKNPEPAPSSTRPEGAGPGKPAPAPMSPPASSREPELAPDPFEGVYTGSLEPSTIVQVEGTFLPVVFKLNEIAREPVRDQLRAELKKDRAFRLELPCANGTRVLERLQGILHKRHLASLWDPKALQRLREPRIVTSYALFLEDLTSEQLLQLLTSLSAGDGQLSSLVLRRLHPSDHKELAALFGHDPTALPSAAGKGGLAASSTVLVAPYPATLGHGGTAAMRRHLETRAAPREGTLSLLLVLRSR